MLLQKKIISLISKQLKCLAVYSNNHIAFIYKENPINIYQVSLFTYEIRILSDVIFMGNYLQLEGFLMGLKNWYKSNEIVLKNPKDLNAQLINTFKGVTDETKYLQQIKELNKKVSELTKNSEKIDVYKKEIKTIHKAAEERNKKITSLNLEVEKLKKDCEEAANIISDLYYKKEDIEYGTKHYKLENFPADVQSFLIDIIKEYYNK